MQELYRASRGNVLFLRELVHGTAASGRLVVQHAVWQLLGPLDSTPRLHELVGIRVGSVGVVSRAVLDLLAAAQPVPLADVRDVGEQVLEGLERAGLIDVSGSRRRTLVSLAHPVYAEVLRASMPMLIRRRLLLSQAARVEATGGRRRGDPVRVAAWRLAATGTADVDLLLTAAQQASSSHDFPQVERLARAALAHGSVGARRAEGELLLGEALFELGSFAEAEEVLAAAQSAVRGGALIVEVVTLRARNLTWGLLRPDNALQVLRTARALVDDPARRQELAAGEALTLHFQGLPRQALALLDEELAPVPDLVSRVLRSVPESVASTTNGRPETGLRVATQGYIDHLALGDALTVSYPRAHVRAQFYALCEAGRLTEAENLQRLIGEAAAESDPTPMGKIFLGGALGRWALLVGRPATARRYLTESLALSRRYGHDLTRCINLTGFAVAAAWLGDASAADAAVRELTELPAPGMLSVDVARAGAWAQVAAGRVVEAQGTLLAAAAAAGRDGRLAGQASLLHDVLRLGAGPATRQVSVDLHALTAVCEGHLVPAYAAHAAAALAGDGAGLLAAADGFEELGMLLLAAEAVAAAATALAGSVRAAAAARARAAGLAERCEGASTPGLLTSEAVVPLTSRERQVAALAAQGLSSRDIAQRLFLSVRTVDNHLQNVYGKLGVTTRGALHMQLGAGRPTSARR